MGCNGPGGALRKQGAAAAFSGRRYCCGSAKGTDSLSAGAASHGPGGSGGGFWQEGRICALAERSSVVITGAA